MSTYRFSAVAAAAAAAGSHGQAGAAGGLDVTVHGAAGESVSVLFAVVAAAASSGYDVRSEAVMVGASGFTKITLGATVP